MFLAAVEYYSLSPKVNIGGIKFAPKPFPFAFGLDPGDFAGDPGESSPSFFGDSAPFLGDFLAFSFFYLIGLPFLSSGTYSTGSGTSLMVRLSSYSF